MLEERKQAAKAEVQHPLDAGVIRPVKYSLGLSNVVLVQKKNKKWASILPALTKPAPKMISHY